MTDSIVPNPPLVKQFQELDAAELSQILSVLLGTGGAGPGKLNSENPDLLTWTQGPGGAVVAQIGANSPAASSDVGVGVTAIAPGGIGSLELIAENGTQTAEVAVQARAGAGNTQINVNVNGLNQLLLSDQLGSGFVQTSKPNNTSRQLSGDPFSCFGAANAAYGPGIADPLPSMGISIETDPGARSLGNGRYSTRNAGVYLLTGTVCYATSGSTVLSLALGITGAGAYAYERLVGATLADSFGFVAILPAAAGQQAFMQLQVSAAITLRVADSQINDAGTTFGVYQIF